jgi:hypothetical protein
VSDIFKPAWNSFHTPSLGTNAPTSWWLELGYAATLDTRIPAEIMVKKCISEDSFLCTGALIVREIQADQDILVRVHEIVLFNELLFIS